LLKETLVKLRMSCLWVHTILLCAKRRAYLTYGSERMCCFSE